ncbi:hypothetical protein N7540_004515 [Penicillium herquei]|nr:hypothetical protein N7540_004515 [Penicillium herquei]
MIKRKGASLSPSFRALTIRQCRRISPSKEAVCTEPSLAQSDVEETDDEWSNLKARAQERLSRYKVTNESEKLQGCFRALLDWLPVGGRDSIAHDILNSDSDEKLMTAFDNIRTCLFLPMKLCGRKRCEYTLDMDNELEDLEEQNFDFRQGCLQRDGNRCVVTKSGLFEKWKEITSRCLLQREIEPAYIIPWSFPSYNSLKDTGDISNIWTTLYQCFPEIQPVVQSYKISEIQNGITLLESIHRQFSDFQCAFEPIPDIPHTYNFVTFEDFPVEMKPDLPQRVSFVDTFRPTSEDRLPHPVLLECHYRLARIFHASGMNEAIDKTLRDLEELKAGSVLACDGSTDLASLLQYAIWKSVTV